jgi:hypothetical protein
MFLTLSEAHVTYLWGQWAQQDKQSMHWPKQYELAGTQKF